MAAPTASRLLRTGQDHGAQGPAHADAVYNLSIVDRVARIRAMGDGVGGGEGRFILKVLIAGGSDDMNLKYDTE